MLRPAGRVRVAGPHFEDFAVGQVFTNAPGLTLSSGHAAIHQAITGDRLRLPLDAELSRAVTGRAQPLAHPNLVCDVAIGQSTGPTQRVRGNLFYRGLTMLTPVFIGDTLRTSTEVVALKQNSFRPGREATGMVALRITTANQNGETVLDFWRCPMIPLRDPKADTGHADSFEQIPQDLDEARVRAAVPESWDFAAASADGAYAGLSDLEDGQSWEIEGRDTVTAAPELSRLTLNVAQAHTDAAASAHGRRLVYGGHTISIAAAHIARALPGLLTVLAWKSCEHRAPVFEGDVLSTELKLEARQQLAGLEAGLVELRAAVRADRDDLEEQIEVLDWRLIGLMV